MRWICAAVLIVFAPLYGQGQPSIKSGGVLNAASYAPIGAPNGGVARGSIFSVFGTNFGPAAGIQVSSFPLQNTLGGVSLNIVQGETTVAAIPIYVNGSQINAIMPSNAPLGEVAVVVTANGQQSNYEGTLVVAQNPGIFTALAIGYGPGAIQNFIDSATTPLNTLQFSASRGQALILWGTGLGAVTGGDNVAPPVGDLSADVKIYVGGKQATNKLYSGRAPNIAGLDQVVFTLPDDTPLGCYVPVQIKANGALSNVVTIAVGTRSQACTEPDNPAATALIKGGRAGNIALARRTVDVTDILTGTQSFKEDSMRADFNENPANNALAFHRFLSLPPAGTCTAFSAEGNLADPAKSPLGGTKLDAGNLTLRGPQGSRSATAADGYTAVLNDVTGGTTPSFFDPGVYQVSAQGGVDVRSFAHSFTLGSGPQWSNRAALKAVNRSDGIRFTWTGAGSVLVAGGNYDRPTNSSGLFVCRVPQGALSFNVPPEVAGLLPATRPATAQSQSYLFFIASPADFPSSIANTSTFGLASALVGYANTSMQQVTIR